MRGDSPVAKRREPWQRGIEKDYPRAPCADHTTLVATRYSGAAIRKWYANYVMLRISGYRLPGPHPTEPTIASSVRSPGASMRDWTEQRADTQ